MVLSVKRQFLYATYEMVGVLYEEGDRENGRGRVLSTSRLAKLSQSTILFFGRAGGFD